MFMYLAECAMCGWESAPAEDTADVSTLALEHLQEQHAALKLSHATEYLRIWSYATLRRKEEDSERILDAATASLTEAPQRAQPAAPKVEPKKIHRK